jgi:uncharacterized metal-binding protein YceD (DUF177 family)
VKALKEFDIHIYRLENGDHTFSFDLNDAFFNCFENSPVSKGEMQINLLLTKNSSMLSTEINGNGWVELICDRSLEKFQHPLHFKRRLIFKLGEGDEELSEEMYLIDKNTQILNLAQYIYEFIGLEIPMRKIHPDYQDENDDNGLYYTTGEEQKNEEEKLDPRWSALKNIGKK